MTITSGTMTGSNQCLAVKSVTTSSFVSHMYDNARGFAGRYWCAIGEQQWGYKNAAFSSNNQTLTFPVTFVSVYSVVLGGGNSNTYTTNQWEASGQLKVFGVSLTNLVVQYTGPKYFIAIGI